MEKLIREFTESSAGILGENLTGVYLHGSAAMGCFNPAKSDLDFIVVVEKCPDDACKRAFMDMVVRLNSAAPAKGIEMSVVEKSVCDPFIYPTPFALHFSERHLDWYRQDPEDYIRKMKGTDKDLAAHFTVIRRRGRCLWGQPVEAVFGEVPREDYIDSIRCDVEDAREDITEDTMYLTLNLARVAAYLSDGLVLSKKEGGEWGLANLPDLYHPLLRAALEEYETGAAVRYDEDLAVRYAAYMLDRIDRGSR